MNDALLLLNGRITTLDRAQPEVEAVVLKDGFIAAVGVARELVQRFPDARRIDAGGRRIVPGTYDSHMHIIRGGLNYNRGRAASGGVHPGFGRSAGPRRKGRLLGRPRLQLLAVS